MVSLENHEQIFETDDLSTSIIDAYVEKHENELTPTTYYGAWYDIAESGLMFLDMSENIADRETALAVGRARKQRSIFDVERGEVIYC